MRYLLRVGWVRDGSEGTMFSKKDLLQLGALLVVLVCLNWVGAFQAAWNGGERAVSYAMEVFGQQEAFEPDDKYEFMQLGTDGQPARVDACQGVDYFVNVDHAPEEAFEVFELALAEISAVSGVEFTYRGQTHRSPTGETPPELVGKEPPQAAQLFVSWAPEDDPLLQSPSKLGISYVSFGNTGEFSFITHSEIIFNATADAVRLESNRLGSLSTYRHELMHALGLAHVDYEDQIMFPSAVEHRDLGAGDVAGLVVAGAWCAPS